MNTASKIFGNHVLFCRDGDAYTVPGAGTVGRSSKPDSTDPVWIDVGIIEKDFELDKKTEEIEIKAPSPGKLRRYDKISKSVAHDLKFKTMEFSPLAFQLLFGTAALNAVLSATSTANTQYNPLGGSDVKGWVKIQQYDQNDVLVNTVDMYCRLEVDGAVKMADDVIQMPFLASILHSTLNTGVLV